MNFQPYFHVCQLFKLKFPYSIYSRINIEVNESLTLWLVGGIFQAFGLTWEPILQSKKFPQNLKKLSWNVFFCNFFTRQP